MAQQTKMPELRDSMRALFYAMPLQKAVQTLRERLAWVQRELALTKDATVVSPSVAVAPTAPQIAEEANAAASEMAAAVSLEREWALSLDDIIVEVVAHQLQHMHAAGDLEGDDAVEQYQRFFLKKNGGLSGAAKALPSQFSYAFTLCKTYVEGELRNVSSALESLVHSWKSLCDAQLVSANGPPLSDIEPTGSDRHCGGKVVLKFKFGDANALFWKPHGGQCARLWADFVALVNLPPGKDLRCMRTMPALHADGLLDDDTYWAEDVVYKPLDAMDVDAYFARCGAFLALAQAVGLSDVHNGNMVVDGQGPVLVDCETLFQVCSPDITAKDAVLSTLMLQEPPRPFSPINSDWMAAFQHLPEMPVDGSHLQVTGERTSALDATEASTLGRSKALPRCDDHTCLLSDHIAPFLDGYNCGWQCMLTALRERSASLRAWAQASLSSKVRVVLRPTSLYGVLLRRARQPDCLKSYERAIGMIKALILMQSSDEATALVEAETQDIVQFNVPLFWRKANSLDVYDSSGRFCFTMTASRQDLWDLARCTATKFKCSADDIWKLAASKVGDDITLSLDDSCSQFAFAVAQQIARSLSSIRIPTQCGPWMSLYDGLVGHTLLLAALYSISADDTLKSLCMRIFTHATELLTSAGNTSTLGIGAASGVGGVIYGLTFCSRLLHEPALLGHALSLALSWAPAVEQDTKFDLMDGAAGWLLCLIQLHDVIAMDRSGPHRQQLNALQDSIRLSVRHLQKHAKEEACGCSWHRDKFETGLTGMSHGNAGVALALRLAQALLDGDDNLGPLVDACDRYEDSHFDTNSCNWRDTRPWTAGLISSWCYGAPGICMARAAGGVKVSDLPSSAVDSLKSAAANFSPAPSYRDLNVCCGASGVITALLYLSHEREDLAARAKAAMLDVLKAVHKQDLLFEGNHGFFTGLSGIAYVALQVAHQGAKLPFVNLFSRP
jgi:lantibiotic modifying enzyme